jgi:DNA-binding NtrC family response regulator
VKKEEFRILIAEDDAIVRDVIVKFLSDQGYSVILAEDGLEAIKLLRVEDIKLVLADLRMPGADGMEVLRTAMQINSNIAVVILTAYGTLDTALDAMKEGAYDYIVKPFVMQQLLLVVRNAYKFANLIEENESLRNQLKDMYQNAGKDDTSGNSSSTHASLETHEVIEKLRERGVIDSDEAQSLMERISPRNVDEKIKRYSSLLNGLKTD